MEMIKRYFKKKKFYADVNSKYISLRNLVEMKYDKLLKVDESDYHNLKFKQVSIYGMYNFENNFKKISTYQFIAHKSEKINIEEIEKLGFSVLSGMWNKHKDMIVYNCIFLLKTQYHLYLGDRIYIDTYNSKQEAISRGKTELDEEYCVFRTFEIKEEQYI